MTIYLLEWKSFSNEDIKEILSEMGHKVIRVPFSDTKIKADEIERLLVQKNVDNNCDFLFSFNYFPEVSICCQKLGIKYVSWVYDSPHIAVYSYTILNNCNYVFLFDYALYDELHSAGIKTVYYMPLAVNEKRLQRMQLAKGNAKYNHNITMVGSLYSEPKHRLYDKFANISPYAKGYLDGIIDAQKKLYGRYILKEMLSPDIVEEMQKAYPTDPNASTVLSPEDIYADYVLARQVTALERKEVLELLGKKHRVDLYTYEKDVVIPGVINHGKIDYYDDMPYVFYNSKINLNVTLRSIKSGIPLRALDIMGSGGFLLSNYQLEYDEYFVPGEDYVFYEDYYDLEEKVEYYLSHDSERREIAENGCRKVREEHNYRGRIQMIMDIVMGE